MLKKNIPNLIELNLNIVGLTSNDFALLVQQEIDDSLNKDSNVYFPCEDCLCQYNEVFVDFLSIKKDYSARIFDETTDLVHKDSTLSFEYSFEYSLDDEGSYPFDDISVYHSKFYTDIEVIVVRIFLYQNCMY